MRPIKLKIKGLNSYIDEQVIDFEKLIEYGLFGIFGETGSGKSTILEAMTIAMYGVGIRNSDEFINSICDRANIVYEFEIGAQNTKRRYIVERTIEKSQENKIIIKNGKLIEIYNKEQSAILAEKDADITNKITEVVGITAQDFTRAVILPQGKFSEFLKLTGLERRNMIERIFGLEKYGKNLIEKVKRRKVEQDEKLLILNTKLSGFEGVSQEVYNKISQELENLDEQEKSCKKNLNEMQEKYEFYKEVYENQISLENYKTVKKELDLKSEDIKDKEIKLDLAFKAEKVNPYIETINSLEKNITNDKVKIDEIDKKFNIDIQELAIIKKQYEDIKSKKDIEHPRLSESKVKIERAIELEKQVNILNKDLLDIKNNYTKSILDKEDLEKTKIELESKQVILDRNLKDLDIKSKDLIISSELKQKIFQLYNIEKEYESIDKLKNKILEKQNNLNNEISETELKYKSIEKHRNDLNEELKTKIENYERLIKKCPGENEHIIKQTETVYILKNKLDLIKENTSKRNIIKEQLNTTDEYRFKLDRDINSTVDKLDRVNSEVNILEKELDKLKYLNLANELRKELKENTPCPVCGSAYHNKTESSKISDNIEYISNKLEKNKSEEKTLKLKLDEYYLKSSSIKSVQEIKKQELSELNNKIGNENIIDLSKKYEDERKKLEILKVAIHTWNKEKNDIEKKLGNLKEDIYNIDKEYIKLKEYINYTKKYLENINIDLEKIEMKYNDKKDIYMNLKSILRINDIKYRVEEIKKNEIDLEKIYESISQKQSNRNENNKNIESLQKQIYDKEIHISRCKAVEEEKKAIREAKYNELTMTTKGQDPKSMLEDIEIEINKIISQEKILVSKLDEKIKQVEEHKVYKNNIEGSIKAATSQYKEHESILTRLLSENKFGSIYEVKKYLLEDIKLIELKNEICEYQERSKGISLEIQKLKDKLGDSYITRESYDSLRQKLQDLRIDIENIKSEKSIKQFKLDSLKEDLINIEGINKDLKNVKQKANLLEILYNEIQENKLVEYVAMDKLKSMAADASKILKSISRGRYELEIDNELKFIMKDNINSCTRNVNTLSGGETFITSLSLAFALSSRIQLKGGTSLGVLFLDEGFDCIDAELLDVVMGSLSELHSDKISIGIITHIEEMKDKVPIKLVVNNNGSNGGSIVNIE